MSNKSPFGSASHFANIVSWNAGSEQSVYCSNNSCRPQLRDQTLCFSAWDGSFFCSCNKGWAWYQHNAELVEQQHTAALRDLKLLVGSGGLDFTKGMDSLDKHVKQISFRQSITFREHGQLKGWQPHFQPTDAKISILSISTIFHWISLVCSSHVSQLRAQSIPCNPNLGQNHCIVRNKSWRPQLRDKALCFSAWDAVFSAAATKGWAWYKHNAELVEHTAALRSLKLLVGSGGLDFTKGMDSFDKHVKQISFRQCITFREHGQLKGWQPHFQPTDAKISILSISTIFHWISLVCSSHVSQLRAQSIPCNPNLGHNHCIVGNKSWRPQLRDQTLCFSAWDSLFSAAATIGWAWCNHNAELVEHTAALRSLKLLVGSGCLEFQNGMAGMDPETNMSAHGANICSWNAHSPVSNPRRLNDLSAVVTEEHNQYIVTLFGDHNSVTKPSASLHGQVFFSYNKFGNGAKM